MSKCNSCGYDIQSRVDSPIANAHPSPQYQIELLQWALAESQEKERMMASKLAEADFGYGGWNAIRGRLERELAELRERPSAEELQALDILLRQIEATLGTLDHSAAIDGEGVALAAYISVKVSALVDQLKALEDFRLWLARTPAFKDIGISDDPPTTVLTIARARIDVLTAQVKALEADRARHIELLRKAGDSLGPFLWGNADKEQWQEASDVLKQIKVAL